MTRSFHIADDTSFRGWVVVGMRAFLAGLGILALHGIFGLVHWYTLEAYGIIGVLVSLFLWGGDRVWHITVGHGVRHPGTLRSSLSRVPFWFLSGGAGYVLGMLASKKLNLIGFYDIPVRPIFLLGGVFGSVLQGVFETVIRRKQLFNYSRQ